jgi:flagellar assembly factor FliW
MPELLTKYFGLIEYPEEAVIEFPSGLPGFEDETTFLMMEPVASAPLTFLQSLRQPGLCFLAMPIQSLDPDYRAAITFEDLESLGLSTGRQPFIGAEIWCLAVIAVAKTGHVTANLLAPVIINRLNRRGVQAIRIDSIYSHQHPVREAAVCS